MPIGNVRLGLGIIECLGNQVPAISSQEWLYFLKIRFMKRCHLILFTLMAKLKVSVSSCVIVPGIEILITVQAKNLSLAQRCEQKFSFKRGLFYQQVKWDWPWVKQGVQQPGNCRRLRYDFFIMRKPAMVMSGSLSTYTVRMQPVKSVKKTYCLCTAEVIAHQKATLQG